MVKIVNMIQIINFEELKKRFDHLNNFNPHVILKIEDLGIKNNTPINNYVPFQL